LPERPGGSFAGIDKRLIYSLASTYPLKSTDKTNRKLLMRILHVIPGIAPRYGGPSRAVLNMCQALEGQGINTLIATTDADGPGRLPVEMARPINYDGVQTLFFPRQASEAFKYSYPLARWLETGVTGFDLVVIHAIFSHSSLAAARACRRHQIPYVLRPLGSLDLWSLRHKRFRKRLMWHCGVNRMIRHATALHYTSDEERKQSERAVGTKRSAIIPLAIDDSLWNADHNLEPFCSRHALLNDSSYVLVLNRLHPVKGLEALIDVFSEATRANGLQGWRLVIAGDGEASYVERLKRHAQERDAERRILFTGWLDGSAKIAALQGAALFALPSRHENFGLSVVEALAFGVPVLISDQVSLAASVQAAGCGWVAALDRRSLQQSLLEALRDQGERVARGAAGRDFVRAHFTWPVVARQLIQFYHECLRPQEASDLQLLADRRLS
jgi:glycosyltransferase involved in cell wall biosynthesis